jgi:hypothetical protein
MEFSIFLYPNIHKNKRKIIECCRTFAKIMLVYD